MDGTQTEPGGTPTQSPARWPGGEVKRRWPYPLNVSRLGRFRLSLLGVGLVEHRLCSLASAKNEMCAAVAAGVPGPLRLLRLVSGSNGHAEQRFILGGAIILLHE